MIYTNKELFQYQVLIAKLLKRGEYEKIREHLTFMFRVAEGSIAKEINGMMFMFDLCHPKKI